MNCLIALNEVIKLVVVLNELGKSYQMLDDALVNMATLSFHSQQEIEDMRRYSLKVQGGRVGVELAKARGHCQKI